MDATKKTTFNVEMTMLFLWASLCEKLNIQYPDPKDPEDPEDPSFTIDIKHKDDVEGVVECLEYAYSGQTILVFTHETCIEFGIL